MKRTKALIACAVATILIAVSDWLVPNISLGILYLGPLLLAAIYLSRIQVMVCAIGAAVLTQSFGTAKASADSLPRFLITLVIFLGAALFVAEIMRRKRLEADYVRRLSEASARRREAEEDARAVIETSPAAILTVKADGTIELANKAAQRLLCLESGSAAPSRNIRDYLPLLADMLKSHQTSSFVRTMVEGRGQRGNGEMFFAHMWLSTYSTPAGPKLAAVVADVSEQVRDREELGLRQLLMNSHIIAGAVSHEVRNLAAAAGALHENIARSCSVAESEDFVALGHLIQGMHKLCSSEIPVDTEQSLTGVDLNALVKELDIILQTGTDDANVEFRWDILENLPRVRAHHSGLLQVLLNLTQNSRRALRGKRNAYVTIAAYPVPGSVLIIVADNGPGITSPEVLFQPFQSGAESSGLGLYVSRAIIRSYGGELRYSKRTFESCFHIELQAMAAMEVTAIA